MSFLRSGLQTMLARLILVFLTFGIGVIHARWLGPEGFGVVTLLLLLKDLAFRFGNLGFGSSFVFFVAKQQADFREIVTMAGKVSLFLSGMSVLLFLALWKIPASPWNDISLYYYAIALAALPFTFYNNYSHRLLIGRLRIAQVNLAGVYSAISQVLFTIFLIIIMKGGIAGAIGASLMSDMVMAIILFHFAKLELKNEPDAETSFKQKDCKGEAGLLRHLWQYGRWNYFLMFSNLLVEEIPTVLLKKFTGDNGLVGFFNRARSFGKQSRLVVEPFAGLLFPFTAASQEEEATRRTNLLCRNSMVIMGITMALLTGFINPIVLLLYGEAFLPTVEIFYVLVPGVIVFPLGHFLEVHVAASGNPRDTFVASVSTLVVAVPICLTLIPLFGAVGAGMSVSTIYMARALFRYIVYVRMTKASFVDVLLPKRKDAVYYQYVFKMLTSGMLKNFRPT